MNTKDSFGEEFDKKKQISYARQLVKQAQQCLEKKARGFETEQAERVLKAIAGQVSNGNFGSLDYLSLVFQEELDKTVF